MNVCGCVMRLSDVLCVRFPKATRRPKGKNGRRKKKNRRPIEKGESTKASFRISPLLPLLLFCWLACVPVRLKRSWSSSEVEVQPDGLVKLIEDELYALLIDTTDHGRTGLLQLEQLLQLFNDEELQLLQEQ